MRAKTTLKPFWVEQYSIQIKLPTNLSGRILTWGDEHIPDDLILTNPDDLAFGREDDPHITVLYRMTDNDPKPIERLLIEQKPFEVTLGKTSVFIANDQFDVLKIDVDGEGLFKLNRLLASELMPPKQFPQYIPHITIGFFHKGKAKCFCNLGEFEGERFMAKDLFFVSRSGEKTKIKMGHK